MSGRLALITGASSGIGAAFAHIYASHGYDLAITARRADRLAAVADEVRLRHGVEALVTVADLMGKGQEAPAVADTASLSEAIVEISQKGYGGAAVVDAEGRLVGAFTDRDLRRALASDDLSACVADHMTRTPVFVAPHVLATEAMRVMNERRILVIFVCDGERLVGAVHMHDLLRAGIA